MFGQLAAQRRLAGQPLSGRVRPGTSGWLGDSGFYTEYGENVSLNDVDKVILQLFYHTKMLTGLDYVLCERIIEKLYY